jgi:hypothetical protein
MLIAKIQGDNITVADYRELFPGTSFPPSGPSAEFLAEQGCMGVTVWKAHNSKTEKLVPAAPYVDGSTVYTVAVQAKTQEELDAATASEAANVRAQRDRLLASCDWMVVKAVETSTALSQDWATYRQALRDISSQEGFPWQVVWPKDPNHKEVAPIVP